MSFCSPKDVNAVTEGVGCKKLTTEWQNMLVKGAIKVNLRETHEKMRLGAEVSVAVRERERESKAEV